MSHKHVRIHFLKQEYTHELVLNMWMSFKISQKVWSIQDVEWSLTDRIKSQIALRQGGRFKKPSLPEERRKREFSHSPTSQRKNECLEWRASKMPVLELSDNIPQHEGKKIRRKKIDKRKVPETKKSLNVSFFLRRWENETREDEHRVLSHFECWRQTVMMIPFSPCF